MGTGYKIKGNDIDSIFEVFTLDEQTNFGVTDSRFTNGETFFKSGGKDLKTAIGATIPTSAGADYPGGYNVTEYYKIYGESINAALLGCRPIGIELRDVGAGSYTIYRENGKTYFSSTSETSNGEELPHSPQYLFFELQAPGGGGGGTVDLYSGSGGGGGGYLFGIIKVDQPIYITVGTGGTGGTGKVGGKGNDGTSGMNSTIKTIFNNTEYVITVNAGGGGEGGNNGNSGGSGGTISYSPEKLDDITTYKIISEVSGAPGTSRRTAPTSNNAVDEFTNNWLKPEGGSFTRPGGSGGNSKDNAGWGGGGGASAFGSGGNGVEGRDGTMSSAYGGGGARWRQLY